MPWLFTFFQQYVRGKHGKKKKMKTKYADQDEDERKMREEMLAPSGPQLTRKQKRELRKGKKSGKPMQASGTQGRWLWRVAL